MNGSLRRMGGCWWQDRSAPQCPFGTPLGTKPTFTLVQTTPGITGVSAGNFTTTNAMFRFIRLRVTSTPLAERISFLPHGQATRVRSGLNQCG